MIATGEISQKLEALLEDLSNSENLVNPFFRISKATPEQTRKYGILNSKFLRTITLIRFIISVFTGLLTLICMFICSLIFLKQYEHFKLHSRQRQVIFISHGIGQNLTQKNGDQFFKKIPDYLQNEGKKVSIIYTNHNVFGFARNSKCIQSKSSNVERFLIPKFLRPSENLTYLNKICVLSFKSFLLGISKIKKEPVESALLLKASTHFLHRATYSNYLLSQRVQDIFITNGIEIVALTFEGHSYEQFIIDKILSKNPTIKIFLYQHSPIVKDHYGLSAFLRKTKHNLYIATTGIHYKKMFEKLSHRHHIEVLGFDKSSSGKNRSIVSDIPNLLFVPEGTTYATKNMLILISRMVKENMNYSFTLRLHPNLKINLMLFWRIKKLKLQKNVIVSTSSLYEDIARAKFVVYRSSAAGIQSLQSSAIPVFYGDKQHSGLNVLGHLVNIYPSLFSINEAINYFKNPSIFTQSNKKNEIFSQMFENINYKKLNTFLNL